jgi:Icc-related predicted phosphoesterase
MRVLLTADLHYTLKQWDWLSLVAENYDVVVLAGDHLDIASLVEVDVQALVVLKYLRKLEGRTRLVVSSGNHDGDERTSANESVARWLEQARDAGVLVDGDTAVVGGWRFTVCPWWDGPETRQQVAALLDREAGKDAAPWVWVYHTPPNQTRVSWTGKGHFGDPILADWVRQYRPRMVLGGHVHQAPFRPPGCWVDQLDDTWFFNAGRQIGPEPAHVVFDFDAMTARWRSLAGEEVLDLNRPLDHAGLQRVV